MDPTMSERVVLSEIELRNAVHIASSEYFDMSMRRVPGSDREIRSFGRFVEEAIARISVEKFLCVYSVDGNIQVSGRAIHVITYRCAMDRVLSESDKGGLVVSCDVHRHEVTINNWQYREFLGYSDYDPGVIPPS